MYFFWSFSYFVRSFFWVLSDTALYEGLDYSPSKDRDHFYADALKAICSASEVDGVFPDFDVFCDKVLQEDRLIKVLDFFSEISPNETRLRWDRMVCFHLLLMAFLNSFGHEAQHSSSATLRFVCDKIKNPIVVSNLLRWINKLGFEQHNEIIQLKTVLHQKIQDLDTEKMRELSFAT